MSLRFRLSLLITLIFLLILGGGSVLIIQNARRAVEDEIRSTAHLTSQLLEVSFEALSGGDQGASLARFFARLGQMEQTRHLHVELHGSAGLRVSRPPHTEQLSSAPGWFVRMLKVKPEEFRRRLDIPDVGGEIVISTDPADEIDEAWKETRTALSLLLAFTLLANVLVFIMIGRALRPIDTILKGLADIEQGDYRSRLADLELPEFAGLTAAFNRMAEVLEKSREQTRFLTHKSLSIQEDERRRLAMEMHDEMGQSISAIKAVAVSIEQRAEDGTVSRSAQTIAEVSDEVYVTIRRMMHQLRPAILDALGLVNALSQLVEEWNERHRDCVCNFVVDGDDSGLTDGVSISLYRVVQEALTNVAKHAECTEVRVELDLANDERGSIELRIRDNGRGMDPGGGSHGLGLIGIRERIDALGGYFRIESEIGAGVGIVIGLPLSGEVDESDQSTAG